MQALSAQYVPTLYALLFAPSSTNASAWSCNATICAVGLAYGLAFRLLKWSRTTEPRGLLSAKDSLIWHNRVLSSVSAVLLLLGACFSSTCGSSDITCELPRQPAACAPHTERYTSSLHATTPHVGSCTSLGPR